MLVDLITSEGKLPNYKGYKTMDVPYGCKRVEFAEVPEYENSSLITHARVDDRVIPLIPITIHPGITPTLYIEVIYD